MTPGKSTEIMERVKNKKDGGYACELTGLKAHLLPLAGLGQKNEKSPLALHSAGKRPSWGGGRSGQAGEVSSLAAWGLGQGAYSWVAPF